MLFSNHHHPNRFFVRPLLTFTTLALFAVACSLFSKKSETPVTSIKNKPTNEMPTPPALPIASGDYADEWKIVDSLQQQGLYKSALEKVTAIQARAQRDKNAPQLVKALIFRGKFTAQLEEDGLTNAILLLEKEMQAAGQPEKAVLQSVIGQLYRVYLEHQGWEIGDRTPVPAGEGGDILTWSADQIEKQALDLYAASVEPAALLASVPLGQFRDITLPGANDTVGKQALWPTLYDLLAQRAIEHFSNERNYLTEPTYAFQLDQASAFAPAEEFVRLAFDSQDITSGKWHAIRLFQKVLAAHLGARDAAFYEAELKRLQFVKNNSTLENKDELYQKAIEKLLGQTENHDSHAEIAHALAGHLHHTEAEDKGANARNAVRILEAAIQRKPDTYGAALCRQLLADIRQPALSTTVEVINPPDQHILVQLGYKNLQKVWIRVVKENADIEKNGRMSWKEKFDRMLALPSLQSRSWDIQNPGDYQMHSTEIALDPLAFGHYWVIVSSNPDFRIDDGPVVFTALDVSNLAVVTYLEKGESRFVLADRNSGTPLESVKLDFFYRDYNTQKSVLKHYGSTLSDRNGFARGNWPERYSMEVRASKGADTIWLNPLQNYRSYDRSEERPAVQFFTDRSIYRPGQTVYFKGLVYKSLQNENGLPQILPNRSVKVQFFDVNGQEKHSITLKSNEFGTFNGAFTAPATGLTGNMSIRATDGAYGATYFNVEEYKRPRFEVTLQPVKGEFRVNEKITMRGEAKNYAGNVVDGASVRYRVLRNAVFPYWDFSHPWRRPWYFDSGEMEIANGVTQSGADGTFSIEFTAIPDPSIPKKSQPTFYYQVMVDVTDITGETRSTESSVNVGYVALQVDWELNNDIHLDSLRHVGLKTTNMAGQALTAQGEITLQRLVAPRRFYKDRMWERPDLTTLAKADFERMFPGLAWKDEDDPKNWGREDFTRTVRFNTADAQTFDLNEGRTQPGWYVVTLRTKDAFGEVIEIQKFVRVWDAESRFEKPDARLEKNRLEPGETAQMLFGGKPDQLHFFFAQENDGIIQKPEWVSARITNLARVEIPVREENRGGIPLHWFCIKDGRIYSGNPQVVVPWSNKELTISYESFRDKLAPGQKEEWRIKISGPKKEKVAAEMVAAMYDASLDQFAPHSWSGLPLP
ncbi:MAG: MG2 domain-containing protein, partial [Saprospiraceae bacterium]|nr:MG2 domain-containing protein [Saprospiraceae bacterium]